MNREGLSMKSMSSRAALVVASLASAVLIAPSPVQAGWPGSVEDAVREERDPTGKTVEVVNKLPKKWEVRTAVLFVDKYTTSKVKFVTKCSPSAWRCVTIRNGKIKTNHTGWYSSGVITIDVAKANRKGWGASAKFRKYLIAHEFGHSRGLPHGHGKNTMYPNAKRQGGYLPLYFNRDQRVTLKKY
jgi:hypothetical protein